MKKFIKTAIISFLQSTGVLPTKWMLRNPFKIYEFNKLTDGISFRKSDVMVDIGCGKGFQTQLLAKKISKIIGIEVNDEQYNEALIHLKNSSVKNKIEYILKPLENANIPEASIDKVISFCVLEHIPNLDVVLKEAYKILKPGGEMHATVDSLANIEDPVLIEKHRTDHFVHQYFTPETITSTLERAGFKVTEAYPIFKSDWARDKFMERIRINVPRKGFFERISFLKKIIEEENKSKSTKGIMVLVRAEKR